MSYRAMNKRDLWEIYRRWQSRQSLSQIASSEGRDRGVCQRSCRLNLFPSRAAASSPFFWGGVGIRPCLRKLIPGLSTTKVFASSLMPKPSEPDRRRAPPD